MNDAPPALPAPLLAPPVSTLDPRDALAMAPDLTPGAFDQARVAPSGDSVAWSLGDAIADAAYELFSLCCAGAALVFVFAPLVAWALAGAWAVGFAALTLLRMGPLSSALTSPGVFALLAGLTEAATVATTAVSYAALCCALMALTAATLGRRRVFLPPALLTGVPCALIFVFGAQASVAALGALWRIPPLAQTALIAYALLAALLLAAYVTDLRPRVRSKGRREKMKRFARRLRVAPTGL